MNCLWLWVAERVLSQLPLTLDPQGLGFQEKGLNFGLEAAGEGRVFRATVVSL